MTLDRLIKFRSRTCDLARWKREFSKVLLSWCKTLRKPATFSVTRNYDLEAEEIEGQDRIIMAIGREGNVKWVDVSDICCVYNILEALSS